MKKNKNILITGSSKGIGLSIAQVLAEIGHNICITGRDKEALNSLSYKNNFKTFFAADLCERDSHSNLYNHCLDNMGEIDILINNAGDYTYKKIEETEETEINNLIRLNIEMPFLLTKLVVPSMKKKSWGRIINIGSISGVVGEANASLYSMTKASLIGFSKALALELAENNITVNTINPGWVDTELIENNDLNEEFSKKEIIEMIPQRRFVHPKEVANLCKYLISEDAKGITGQSINLCAGLSLG